MKNSEYWKSRFDIIEDTKAKAGQHAITDIEAMFRESQRELERQIAAWYGRFALGNRPKNVGRR